MNCWNCIRHSFTSPAFNIHIHSQYEIKRGSDGRFVYVFVVVHKQFVFDDHRNDVFEIMTYIHTLKTYKNTHRLNWSILRILSTAFFNQVMLALKFIPYITTNKHILRMYSKEIKSKYVNQTFCSTFFQNIFHVCLCVYF